MTPIPARYWNGFFYCARPLDLINGMRGGVVADEPDGYFTDQQGTVHPIRNRKAKRGWVAGAIALGVLLGGGTVSVDSASLATRTGQSARPGSQARPQARGSGSTADAARAAQRVARTIDRLRRQEVQVRLRASSDDTDCVAHSYGQVRHFFRAHPCIGLHRALLEVTAEGAGSILIALASVRMPDQRSAVELKALLDRYGTGNVVELSRESGRYRRIRFTGKAYASRLDGDTATNAQAQPVAPGLIGRRLTEMVTNAIH